MTAAGRQALASALATITIGAALLIGLDVFKNLPANTHPEPDSTVMEPAADGSHWVTPAGTRVYLLHAAGMVCAVAEGTPHGKYARPQAVGVSCLPEGSP